MKIFHLTSNSSAFSGAARQLIQLAQSQVQRRHEVVLGFRDLPNPYLSSIFNEAPNACSIKLFKQPGGESAIFSFLNQFQPNIFHLHCESHHCLLCYPQLMDICPIVINIGHSRDLSLQEINMLRDQRISAIVAVSKTTAMQLQNQLTLSDLEKVFTVYSTTDLAKFYPHPPDMYLVQKYSLTPENVVIGFLANLYPYKGHLLSLRTIEQLRAFEFGSRIKIVLVGRDHMFHANRILSYIQASPFLRERTHVVGGVPDPERYLSIFTFLLSISENYEGICGAIREAMAMRIPVICSSVGGNNELAEDFVTARVVPDNNKECLISAVLWLVRNLGSKVLNEICDRALDRIRNIPDPFEKCVMIEKIYERVQKTVEGYDNKEVKEIMGGIL